MDLLWVYIGVPTVLVSILVLLKLRQEKMSKRVESAFSREEEEEVLPSEKEAPEESLAEAKETQTKPEFSTETRSKDCSHYLGYLYMKKAPNRTHIPTECYNCRDLLQCLYSPRVVEKVYGE